MRAYTTRRAGTTCRAGLTMVLLLSVACSAPEAPGQTSDDAGAPTLQTFVQVPQGFAVSVFAEGLPGVRMLEMGPDDRLYAVRTSAGEVVRFELNADGTASGGPAVVVSGLRQPFGLAFRDGDLYVGETHQVIRLRGPGFTQETIIVPGLPTGGHSTREIEFGPDGRLYVSVGSSCNICVEDDERRTVPVRNSSALGCGTSWGWRFTLRPVSSGRVRTSATVSGTTFPPRS